MWLCKLCRYKPKTVNASRLLKNRGEKSILKKLDKWHMTAAVLHFINFLATLVLTATKSFYFPQSTYEILLPKTNVTEATSKSAGYERGDLYYMKASGEKINLPWLVVVFFLITFIAHLMYAFRIAGINKYMKQGRQPYRWIEFSLSAGIMAIIQDMLSGIEVRYDIFMQVVSVWIMMLFGYYAEFYIFAAMDDMLFVLCLGQTFGLKEDSKSNDSKSNNSNNNNDDDNKNNDDNNNDDNVNGTVNDTDSDVDISLQYTDTKNERPAKNPTREDGHDVHEDSQLALAKIYAKDAYKRKLEEALCFVLLGFIPFLAIWVPILWSFFEIIINLNWPSRLYWIPMLIIGEFTTWSTFAFPLLWRIYKMNKVLDERDERPGPKRNGNGIGLYGKNFFDYERNYILLSFVAKTYLGWVLFGGVK